MAEIVMTVGILPKKVEPAKVSKPEVMPEAEPKAETPKKNKK